MKTYGDWRKTAAPCRNCEAYLESRPVYGDSIIIKGLEAMEYRHPDGGCATPEVYSGWNKYRNWQEGE